MWLLFFERLGDEYFSWWYVQPMLPYGTGKLAFMHLYSSFNLRLLWSIFLYIYFLIWYYLQLLL